MFSVLFLHRFLLCIFLLLFPLLLFFFLIFNLFSSSSSNFMSYCKSYFCFSFFYIVDIRYLSLRLVFLSLNRVLFTFSLKGKKKQTNNKYNTKQKRNKKEEKKKQTNKTTVIYPIYEH